MPANVAVNSGLDVEQVQDRLTGGIVGWQVRYYPELSSTNDEARRLAAAGEAEGTVVVAETQTAGRGRRGRQWLDIPGRFLLFSIILRPAPGSKSVPVVSLGTAAAAAQVLSEAYDLPAATKWPNDLLIDGRKIGGILLEAADGFVVIGMGLNVNGKAAGLQKKVPQRITTMEDECGHPVQREEVLAALLEKIETMYGQFQGGEVDAIIAAYKQRDCVVGRDVAVEVGGEKINGWAIDISPTGSLIIQTNSGRREITAGDVYLLSNCGEDGRVNS